MLWGHRTRCVRVSTMLGAGLACLALNACGGAGSPGAVLTGDQPAAQPPLAGDHLTFPEPRAAASLTEATLAGVQATRRSSAASPYGDSLVLGDPPQPGAQFAVYRFNLAGADLDSLIVRFKEYVPGRAYIGLANYDSQRWEFSGPYSTTQVLLLEGRPCESPVGDVWVAVMVPAGAKAIVEELTLRRYSPENALPVALSTSDVSSGPAPLAVSFDASTSSDPDGTIAQYQWDWDEDGVYDHVSDTPLASHTFSTQGLLHPRLRVVDNSGGLASKSIPIFVQEAIPPPYNAPPTASFTHSAAVGAAPLLVSLDASTSSDPDGTLALYEWDWEDDGVYDAYGQSPLNSHVYTVPGCHNVRLRVTDNGGKQAVYSGSWDIVVTPTWQPLPQRPAPGLYSQYKSTVYLAGKPLVLVQQETALTLLQSLDTAGATWAAPQQLAATADSGTAQLQAIAGRLAIAYSSGGELRYIRALDDAGTLWSAPVIVAPGTLAWPPALREVSGTPALVYVDTTSQQYYVRAADAQGSAWGAPVVLGDSSRAPQLCLAAGNPAYLRVTSAKLFFIRALDSTGSAWGAAQELGPAPQSVALALVAGRPALAAYRFGSISYRQALDAAGSSWDAPVAMPTPAVSLYGLNLAELAGRPALAYVAYNGSTWLLGYRAALAADGSVWDNAQTLGPGWSPELFEDGTGPLLYTTSNGEVTLSRIF